LTATATRSDKIVDVPMHINLLELSKFSHTGSVEIDEADRSDLEIPCACPAPKAKGHRYNCAHFKVVLRSLLEQKTGAEKETITKSLRLILEALSEDDDKTDYIQLKQTLEELGE
jgi:hypothetical protein